MDIREFSNKLAEATKNMSEEEQMCIRDRLLYLQDIHKERNPSFVIHRTTAEFYGYKNLDDAEQKLRTR